MIRCVAFDLDGVVIRTEPSFALFEREHGITREAWREVFAGDYQAAMRGEVDLFDLLPPFLARWSWRGTRDEFVGTWFGSCIDADPEVAALIRSLRAAGLRCCAASNQDNRRAAYLDAHAPLRALLPERFFSCWLRAAKPGADYFRAIERALGCAPHEILFVDDRPENVAGARACGWRGEVATGAASVRAALALHAPHALSRAGITPTSE